MRRLPFQARSEIRWSRSRQVERQERQAETNALIEGQCDQWLLHLQGLGMVGCDFFPSAIPRRSDLAGPWQCQKSAFVKIYTAARG